MNNEQRIMTKLDQHHSSALTLIGRYDATDEQLKTNSVIKAGNAPFYNADKQLIRVRTEIGILWVPLFKTGLIRNEFNPYNEIVLVFISDKDYINNSIEDENGNVINSDIGFAVIANVPPQTGIIGKIKEIIANMPTKVLDNSSSDLDGGYEINSDGYGIKVDGDVVHIKSKGSEIRLGKDSLIERGNKTSLNFFNESKAGVLKQSWLSHLIPTTVVTPFPMYEIDTKIVDMIKSIADAVKAFKDVL